MVTNRQREILETMVFLAILFMGFYGVNYGLKLALNTEYPLEAVISPSMYPTLKVGDLIVVQGGMKADQIVAGYPPVGDIIVFHKPNNWNELIVHRVIEKRKTEEGWCFITRGDNNPSRDPYPVPEKNMVGKVIGRIPLIGYIRIIFGTTTGLVLIVAVIVILLFSDDIIGFIRKSNGKTSSAT